MNAHTLFHYFGLLLLAVVAVSAQNDNLSCFCTKKLLPVCGSDGKTYSNFCYLNCAKFASKNGLRLAYNGKCKEEIQNEEVYYSVDVMPKFYKKSRYDSCGCKSFNLPVCGSNNKTYRNPCLLSCAKINENNGLVRRHYGPCLNQNVGHHDEGYIPGRSCSCNNMVLLPVCGSDGKTYRSPCKLKCAQQYNPDLWKVRYGPCFHSYVQKDEFYDDSYFLQSII